MTLRIGLTGGIGSGKSTVAGMLASLGADILDTDAIARSLTLPGGAAIEPIREAFGDTFIAPDGALDRVRMREAAFGGGDAKRRLEAILHPLIGDEVERRYATSQSGAAVFDIPLLVESGRWRRRLDRVWVVDCAEATQVGRVVARPGWTAAAAQAVIEQQASRIRRRAAADAVIDNDTLSLKALALEVAALWRGTVA